MALQEEMRDWHVDPHAAGAFGRSTRHWRKSEENGHIKPITVEEKARCMGGYRSDGPKDRNMDVQAVVPCNPRKGKKAILGHYQT
jgi:hypothetical protein